MSPIDPTIGEFILGFGPVFLMFLGAALILAHVVKSLVGRATSGSRSNETDET